MHRFHSSSTIASVRIASVLVCLRCLCVPLTLGGLVYSLILHDQKVAVISLAMIPVIGVLILLQMLVGIRTQCPLCMTPVLGEKSCNKHKKAFRLCGSYKLPVAVAVLFRNSFRCPYCNEPSLLEVRSKRR